MKAFNRTAIALCLSLAILFLTIGPAAAEAANNSILEIRGPVYSGSDINDILTKNSVITMDANNFATFYYETDPNVITENLTFK